MDKSVETVRAYQIYSAEKSQYISIRFHDLSSAFEIVYAFCCHQLHTEKDPGRRYGDI